MASNDPGLAPFAANADDPRRGGVPEKEPISPTNDEILVTEDRPIPPDQCDPQLETSRWEIWSYYAYYVGNNGLSLFNFAPTAF